MWRAPLPYFALGLAALYLGERTLADKARLLCDGLGLALLVFAVAMAAWRLVARKEQPERRAALLLLLAYAVASLGVGLYGVVAYLLPAAGSDRVRVILSVAWPVLVLAGVLPALAMELAWAPMARAARVELWRLSVASRSAMVVVLALVAFAGANYAASQWNHKVDLSYFRTTRPSDATLRLAQSATEDTKLVAFFPPGNDVLEQARPYLEEVAQKSPKLHLEIVDQALVPDVARDLKVRNNGYIVVTSGAKRESLYLGVRIEDARSQLKKLDGEVQKMLTKVMRASRVAYFTTGHLERDWTRVPDDHRLGMSDFKSLLDQQGFTVKRLGLAEGLGSAVPDDATLVIVAGPIEPFLDGEVAALHAYLDRGGRLLVLADPDHGDALEPLLAPLGVTVSKALVGEQQRLVRIEGSGVSAYNFAAVETTYHDSVLTLARSSRRMGVVLLGSGRVERAADTKNKVVLTLRTSPDAWLDTDANGVFDKGSEKQGPQQLVAAIESPPKAKAEPQPGQHKEGEAAEEAKKDTEAKAAAPYRAIVTGDADLAGDVLLRNAGNYYIVADGLRWLVGDEELAGEVQNEEDVPLVHRKEGDAVWFYGVSFVMPALVLGVGLLVSWPRQRRRRR